KTEREDKKHKSDNEEENHEHALIRSKQNQLPKTKFQLSKPLKPVESSRSETSKSEAPRISTIKTPKISRMRSLSL
ncbi:hypothetical protein PJI19_29640, partial [Mycobacterium kansasii]